MKAYIQRLYQATNSALVFNLLFPTMFLLFSFEPCKANGVPKPVIRKTLKIDSAFQNIRIEGDVSVKLTNDAVGTVIIEGKEKVLNKVRPVFKNNMLIIEATRAHLFSKVILYVSAVTLRTIQINGDGNISSVDFIRSEHLHLWLNGNIHLKVKTLGQVSVDTPDDFELLWKSPGTLEK